MGQKCVITGQPVFPGTSLTLFDSYGTPLGVFRAEMPGNVSIVFDVTPFKSKVNGKQ